MWTAFQLLAGLVLLYGGAEGLVKGAAALARRFGISPLMVGLTVVAYGTSAPELIVSSMAALQGKGALALGNAVGSNVFNIGLVLGLTAMIAPIRVQSQLVKFDTPVMVGVAVLFLVMFSDGWIDRVEAVVLVLGAVAYTALHVRVARNKARPSDTALYDSSVPAPGKSRGVEIGLVLAGLVALSAGSRLFVDGAVALARLWGVSEAVIGLTIVAAGTGLPELAASVVAACRRQTDIAIGNIVGSNIYNILAIVGISGTIAGPLDGTGLGVVEVVLMVAVSAVMLPLVWSGSTLRRWEGLVLFGFYGLYLWHLWVVSSGG